MDGDGLRAHWLPTILQECSAASNSPFFATFLYMRSI
jgi:hypothetical protein